MKSILATVAARLSGVKETADLNNGGAWMWVAVLSEAGDATLRVGIDCVRLTKMYAKGTTGVSVHALPGIKTAAGLNQFIVVGNSSAVVNKIIQRWDPEHPVAFHKNLLRRIPKE
jgi:hypothetical protein